MRGADKAINHSAPDAAPIALLIVDMFADYESDGMDALFRSAIKAARRIALLRDRARAASVPVIFVNDNYGRWRSSGAKLLDKISHTKSGRAILDMLRPEHDDYLLLKPKHSIFFATPLEVMLSYIGAKTLILTGSSGLQCILFSAMDAHVRDYKLLTPRDCIVTRNRKESAVVEYMLRESLKADTRTSTQIRFSKKRAKKTSASSTKA